jgi:NitT/TauT family transport system substrate-binding protein
VRPWIPLALVVFLMVLGCNNWEAERRAMAGPAMNPVGAASGQKPPLRVVYSDWPSWAALEIAVERGWFRKMGLRVELSRSDYVSSLDAFSSKRVDAITVTNSDALVMGAAGAKSRMILVIDYSNGNDKIVARPGIETFKDLKGKRVGLEFTLAEHLLFLKACEKNGINSSEIALVNFPTSDTPQALTAGDVAAVGASYPIASQALRLVPGAKTVFTSADVPGLIYGALAVSPASLAERREDWVKFARVWYWIADFIRDPKTHDLGIAIMASRAGLRFDEYAAPMAGTHLLSLSEAKMRYARGGGLDSVYGSTSIADDFNVSHKVYRDPQRIDDYIDPRILESL